MNKKHIRKEVIEHLIQLKQDEINVLKESKKIYSESADLDEESSLEIDDFSQQDQANDSARNLQIRINQATEDLENFKTLRPELVDEITEGNVVFTDKVNFVIGLSFKDFEWEDKKFVGISTQAPIFEALVGKRVGDKLEFNGIDYSIEEIL
ncbi:hypothetical protein [Empedobacter brevis]|uniref:hypothetical protein n=1 Tax=Empedobacter brevis TaxID=247 RepID=UPI0039AFFF68